MNQLFNYVHNCELRTANCELFGQLDISKIDSLVKTMCLAWASDKCEYPNETESLYQKEVIDAVASGADELAAISAWMQQLQTTKAGAV
ncbi:hypothetical protein [Nostoc sphaeroides]|uniref:hypothetical protein n=1 Tax=Nostoc sphaeroides TaxID=446679 RepID=UPI001884441B|nr:hypothetical protein [Nostoc sphaeroides]